MDSWHTCCPGAENKDGRSRVGKGVFPAPIPHLCPQEWPAADTSVLAANPGGALRDRLVPGGGESGSHRGQESLLTFGEGVLTMIGITVTIIGIMAINMS